MLLKNSKAKRDANALYESINRSLESIGKKLDRLIELHEAFLSRFRVNAQQPSFEGLPLDINTLLSLPDHLRKTAMALCSLGEATAEQVAVHTGRTRAAESDYLNQLVSLGHIRKERRGRDVYFTIKRSG